MMTYPTWSKISLLLLCFTYSAFAATTPPKRIKGFGTIVTKSVNLHIIAIGINQYGETGSRLPNLGGAVFDVQSLTDSLVLNFNNQQLTFNLHKGRIFETMHAKDPDKPPGNYYSNEIYRYVLTDQQATPEAIEKAFKKVIASALPEDIVVFQFSGIALPVYDSTFHETLPYFIPYVRMDSLERDLPSKGISIAKLRDWLELIPAHNQLIITDAWATKRNTAKYLERFLIAGKSIQNFVPRNRVIVASNGASIEGMGIGGQLTHSFKSLGNAIFELFDGAGKRGKPYLSFINFSRQHFPDESFDIFFEQEFWNDVTYLTTDAIGTRGGFTESSSATPSVKPASFKNYALVIGTDEYESRAEWPALKNPVFDAQTVAQTLHTRYAFDTTLLVNPTLDGVYSALNKLQASQYDSTSQVFIFIAGHGGNDEFVSGFLAFRDGKPKEKDPHRKSYLKYSELRDMLDGIPCKHVFLVLDACFGGTFVSRYVANRANDEVYGTLDRDEKIRRKLKLTTRKYLTSGGKEYVSDGEVNKHSPFARRFIAALQDGAGDDRVLTYAEICGFVEDTNTRQQPRMGDFGNPDPGSDFLFVEKSN